MNSQKQSVCNTILSVYKERTGEDYELNGEVIMFDVLTKDDYSRIRAIIIEGFIAEEISLSADARVKHADNKYVTYTNGLIKNWVKKNPDFNAGQKYEPKNKGSRAGQGDETIRALRSLLKTPDLDQESIDEINKSIATRLAEIKPAKAVAPINVDALPEHLKHLASKA